MNCHDPERRNASLYSFFARGHTVLRCYSQINSTSESGDPSSASRSKPTGKIRRNELLLAQESRLEDQSQTPCLSPRIHRHVPVCVCTIYSYEPFGERSGRRGPGVAPPSSGSAGKITGDLANGMTRDPREESVWRAAQQLGLTSDQRSELASSFKAGKEERAALDKALQDARRALADSLANGQTFLDSEIENLTSANAKVQESELKLWAKHAVLLLISKGDC